MMYDRIFRSEKKMKFTLNLERFVYLFTLFYAVLAILLAEQHTQDRVRSASLPVAKITTERKRARKGRRYIERRERDGQAKICRRSKILGLYVIFFSIN